METTDLDYREFSSYFINDMALFGSYPNTATKIKTLQDMGVILFVDLTTENEFPYREDGRSLIKYPIADKSIPTDKLKFCKFILGLVDVIKGLVAPEKIYIHCRGGHGRAGIVVACILAVYYDITADEALKKTRAFHQQRLVMRDKWRHIGAPQTFEQKEFVRTIINDFFHIIKMQQNALDQI